MKKITLLLMVLLMAVTANAKVKIGGLYYELNKSKRTAQVTYYKGGYDGNANYVKGNLKIPKMVNYSGKTYSVTSIGDYAFDQCRGLTSITIPNSVKSIGYDAFAGCSGLKVYISDLAAWCKIDFGGEEGSNPLESGTLYVNGVRVKNLIIPNSVTKIGGCAFYGCDITSVVIPNSVKTIGSYAFKGSDLTRVEIGNSVTSIGTGAFELCGSLTSITIPNSVTYIGDFAFDYCSHLTRVELGNSVTYIGACAFAFVSRKNVKIPKSVTYIGEGAFADMP